MMSCPMPMPLPLLPPALHGDFPPVHIGVKRGSDELLAQTAIMAPASDNNNHQDSATKKVKLEGSTNKPSRVIHIRNIPAESSEAEIVHLGVPFGRVTNVLVLKGKNQAFLEMSDENSAAAMVAYFNNGSAQLRGRAVYVQFSNHTELKTDKTHSNTGASAQAALQAAQQFPVPSVAGSPLPADGNPAIAGGPNTVLRVIVENLLYPVTLDILHQIFQRFGKVMKIVTFTKNNSFQALIQYPDSSTANSAKVALDGQNIYNGCCTLRIDYSKMSALNVKYNNDKSRDYTNPSLPAGENGPEMVGPLGGMGGLVSAGGLSGELLLLAAAGQRPGLARERLAGPGVLPPFALGLGSPLASGFPSGLGTLGGSFALTGGALGATSTPPALRGISTVLLVSNLNEDMVTPDALFTLFGVYGDVQRVKILYNKKDSALIQLAEPHQAHLAITHLDKLRLYGKAMRVMSSKHQSVQLPKEGQPDAGLTRDYSQSTLHRFKKPGSKNYQNIYPPSATLHLSNIPASVTEEEIREAFVVNNFSIKAFKFFPKDRKMALLQLSSVEEAVAALIKMHNHQLSESNHLRVSFSKHSLQKWRNRASNGRRSYPSSLGSNSYTTSTGKNSYTTSPGRNSCTSSSGRRSYPASPGRNSDPTSSGRRSYPSSPGKNSNPATPGRNNDPKSPGRRSYPSSPGQNSNPTTPGRNNDPKSPGRRSYPTSAGKNNYPTSPGSNSYPAARGRNNYPRRRKEYGP